jgi:hypothetical protein
MQLIDAALAYRLGRRHLAVERAAHACDRLFRPGINHRLVNAALSLRLRDPLLAAGIADRLFGLELCDLTASVSRSSD